MVKSETHRDAETLVCKSETEIKKCKTSHQNKCHINKTLRLFAKAVEILKLDEKFASAKILEVPFATPSKKQKTKKTKKQKGHLEIRYKSERHHNNIISSHCTYKN